MIKRIKTWELSNNQINNEVSLGNEVNQLVARKILRIIDENNKSIYEFIKDPKIPILVQNNIVVGAMYPHELVHDILSIPLQPDDLELNNYLNHLNSIYTYSKKWENKLCQLSECNKDKTPILQVVFRDSHPTIVYKFLS